MRIFRNPTWNIAAALLPAAVARDRAGAGGVTVITHGFNSDVESWIIPMAEKMPGHAGFPGTQSRRYRLRISSTSSPAIATRLAGVAPAVSDSGEIFICLDWSAVDGAFQATTTQVAQLAVNALTDQLLTADTGGRSLVELPLHFIGHSRGASVATEMARLLGQQGLWVDQVTTLDPYPVAIFGDATVRIWKNILFADNIWQNTSGELITGQNLAGAYNRRLLSLGGGNDSAHSDVHLWYHGMIDLATPATDTQATIGKTNGQPGGPRSKPGVSSRDSTTAGPVAATGWIQPCPQAREPIGSATVSTELGASAAIWSPTARHSRATADCGQT